MAQESASKMGEIESDLKTADELFNNDEPQGAYEILIKYKDNAEVEWRLVRACRVLAIKSADSEKKKALAYEAQKHAKLGLSLDDKNFACHKVSVKNNLGILEWFSIDCQK